MWKSSICALIIIFIPSQKSCYLICGASQGDWVSPLRPRQKLVLRYAPSQTGSPPPRRPCLSFPKNQRALVLRFHFHGCGISLYPWLESSLKSIDSRRRRKFFLGSKEWFVWCRQVQPFIGIWNRIRVGNAAQNKNKAKESIRLIAQVTEKSTQRGERERGIECRSIPIYVVLRCWLCGLIYTKNWPTFPEKLILPRQEMNLSLSL